MSDPIRFSIIGAGWRTEFFMRIAQALPEQFLVERVLVRDAEKAQAFTAQWDVPTCATLDELLHEAPGKFVVTSVPHKVNTELLHELTQRGVPVLSETPPAHSVDVLGSLHELTKQGARIQVAEQLHLRPIHAARIGMAQSGLLGRVTQAQVSVAHAYHGVSLIRRLLGITFEDATITGRRFKSQIVKGPGRQGPPSEESVIDNVQDFAWLDFGDKLGVFDFTGEQYFSYVRSCRMLVRGDRGEINNDQVRYLEDFRTPILAQLRREAAGEDDNLEGSYLKGILCGESWVYRNPFAPGRLSDDEIAIADCLRKMSDYVDGGPDFYSLAEASQDTYLGIMINEAIASGEQVVTQPQPWAC